jgi:hypothetical protein
MWLGVSQQPPQNRVPGMADYQENVLGTIAEGALKRPPVEFISLLNSHITSGSYVYTIDRSINEKYLVIITSGVDNPIEVFNLLTYEKCNVIYENGTKDYAIASKPQEVFSAITIADYTFLANNTIKVQMSGNPDPIQIPTAIVFTQKGIIRTSYHVFINGSQVASYTTGDTETSTVNVTTNLYSNLVTNLSTAQWNIQRPENSSFIQITRFDGADFDFRVSDSYGEQALIGGKGVVQNVTNLPPKAIDGLVLKIEGDSNSDFDNYYVKYINNEGTDSGVWVEAPKPGLDNNFNNATMPHKLARTGVNEFTFGEFDWKPRCAGDEVSCSEPSFVGSSINDLFTFKGRLGFLSGENFICSRPNDQLNFWPAKASKISDSDPIDLSPDSQQVFTLRHAVPFNTSFILFSDQLQFVVSSGDNLFTVKNITADQTTAFKTSAICKPIPVGPNVYFVTPGGKYSQLREYYVQPDTLVNDAANVTVHVPRYLPKNIISLTSNSAHDIIFALSSDEPKRIYVYKYLWNGEEKVQSSWSFWSFDDEVLGSIVLDNYLYLIMKGTDGATIPTEQVYLAKINIEKDITGDLPFRVHLDKMVEITGMYNAETKKTVWTLPYNDGNTDFVVVESNKGNRILNTVKTSPNTIEAPGNYSSTSCFVGKNYTKRYRLSEWYMFNSNTNAVILDGKLQHKEITFAYTGTGYFRVEITPFGFYTEVYENTCVILGQSILGEPSIVNGKFEVVTSCDAEGCKIEIINDTYLPSEIQSTALIGNFETSSRSV